LSHPAYHTVSAFPVIAVLINFVLTAYFAPYTEVIKIIGILIFIIDLLKKQENGLTTVFLF